ncbi:signal peptide peptidase SppA [candidate division KSB1 bacterium]|nr:signal peptide peptidase SppA [candidate division KSB1 bacterium]
MTSYHLASVADKIVLDPQGSILLQGYVLDRTYLKGTLEKLGLGFDEWRFFKYKSANETFSRDSMSEADHKQLQAYVDDWYELTRAEVCSSRFLSQQTFDQLIDEETYFMPEEALESGLVDTLARWSEIDGIVKSTTGTSKKALSANSLLASALPQQNWGELPKVAVVYGLGVCALDEGIKARWLEGVFLALKENKSVKAVVFRVDSPGGDGMASDLVAEALKKCSESKPVIISQGQVAGSGGYWISMYGDQIVAGPNTVTGSIGVIGGWVYDKGLSEKIGMTSDLVRRGKHADLGHGVSIPYLNLEIPARNLTPEERAEVEEIMKKSYHIFVKKVAEGRGLSEEKVREIAEGRVYSGIDGQENGLVDEIGGLLTAIALAKEKSGLEPTDEVQIVEIPEHEGLFDLREQFSPVALKTSEAPVMQFLKILSEHPGEPMFMMLPGTYPSADR